MFEDLVTGGKTVDCIISHQAKIDSRQTANIAMIWFKCPRIGIRKSLAISRQLEDSLVTMWFQIRINTITQE